jgi:phosphatidate cytidylyltransferase
MLAQRIITALILIPLVFAGVLYLPTHLLALIVALLVLIGGVEWSRLARIETVHGRLLFLLLLLAVLGGMALVLEQGQRWIFWMSLGATVWWILVTFGLLAYRPGGSLGHGRAAKVLFGLLVLTPAWASVVVLHGADGDGPTLVLSLLILVWVADSGAYFAGRRWGRTKLAPMISPGKTREGVYGAVAGAVICGLVLTWIRPETGHPLLLILLCVAVTLISVVGDLFESLLKRQAEVKDSGTLLPGHGGMLDRIDSLTAAAPLYLFGLLLLGLQP